MKLSDRDMVLRRERVDFVKRNLLSDIRGIFNKYEKAVARCPLHVAFSLANAREPLGLASSQSAALQLSN